MENMKLLLPLDIQYFAGVLIGVSNVVVWELESDPAPGSGPATYKTPKALPGVISANINPNATTATLFADDGPYESAASQGEISLELNMAELSLADQAFLLGHTIEDGILVRKGADSPPTVAVAFRSLKSNGKYRYTTLTKGKFSLPEQNNQTKADSIEFNTPTITGAFLKRTCDDQWQRQADEDDPEAATKIPNWFLTPDAEPPSGGGGGGG